MIMIVTMITFQSCTVLSHSLIMYCGVCWHLISLQTCESITQSGVPKLLSKLLGELTRGQKIPSAYLYFVSMLGRMSTENGIK